MGVWSRDSSAGLVTRLRAGQPRNRASIPARGKRLFSPPKRSFRPVLGPIQLPIPWVAGAISAGRKRQQHEADHSPPSRVEVKNGGATAPIPRTSSRRRA
jgi:hypothetical protein